MFNGKGRLFCLLFFAFNFANFSIGQNLDHTDCSKAFEVCELRDYHIESFLPNSNIEVLNIQDQSIVETNSVWFNLLVNESGLLSFTIIPDFQEDDLDFILYEIDDNDCSSKEPIRIMTSGPSLSKKRARLCLGQTGLIESSYDIQESKGCNFDDDNFLSSAQLNSDNRYVLFVNNFNSTQGFSILFEGDKYLKLKNLCNREEIDSRIELYPNPVHQTLQLHSSNYQIDAKSIQIINVLGEIVYQENGAQKFISKSFDVKNYDSGKYILRIIHSDETVSINSFVRI